jgi:hypothetical protein
MRKHWRYLLYVVRHKYFVLVAGRELGLGLWQLLIHDYQKFFPSEWTPYVETFYGEAPNMWADAFDRAWLHHQKGGGEHHWQYWLLPLDDGGTKVLEMPERYAREMLADWMGAGRAITGRWEVAEWYEKNKDAMQLHPKTRACVETEIRVFA